MRIGRRYQLLDSVVKHCHVVLDLHSSQVGSLLHAEVTQLITELYDGALASERKRSPLLLEHIFFLFPVVLKDVRHKTDRIVGVRASFADLSAHATCILAIIELERIFLVARDLTGLLASADADAFV